MSCPHVCAMIPLTQLTPVRQARAPTAVCDRMRGGSKLSRKSRVACSRVFVEAYTPAKEQATHHGDHSRNVRANVNFARQNTHVQPSLRVPSMEGVRPQRHLSSVTCTRPELIPSCDGRFRSDAGVGACGGVARTCWNSPGRDIRVQRLPVARVHWVE